jgi:micrococcal nuclease
MSEKKPVSIAVQVILCLIPLVWIYGFFRIEKLISGILMLIGVVIMAFVIQIFIPFYLGYALAWLVSFLVPIHYMIKWSREWNDNITHYEKKFVKSNNLIPAIGIVVAVLFILALVGFNQISQHTETEKTPISVSPQIKNQPTKSEMKTEPELVKTEVIVEPKTDPVKPEPVQTEPVQTEPVMGCSGTANCITGNVTKIVDGDTLDINGIRIRISLTNTPERNHAGFLEATEFTKLLCPVGSIAHVDQDDLQLYDVHNRTLGKVTCSGGVLNSELLYHKLADISTQFCSTSEFSKETWAQQYGCATTNQSVTPQIPKEIPKTSSDENNCDPSYPDFCIPPSPPDLNCKDVLPYKKFTVKPPDPHGFDGDGDGIGCEGK